MKTIFNDCQFLESIKIWCDCGFTNEREMLETVVKCSPKSFYELGFCYNNGRGVKSVLLPEELESIIISWSTRIPLKPLSLINDKYCMTVTSLNIKENKKIIKKYIHLGIIKKFEITYLENEFYYNE